MVLQLACTETGSSSITLAADASEATLSLAPPDLLTHRAINQELLMPRVTVNSNPVSMIPTGGQWSGTTSVLRGTGADIRVVWEEQYLGRALPLAEFTQQIATVTSTSSVSITAEDYQTDGLDSDADQVSNLLERINNTNPFDAQDPLDRGATPMARISFIAPADAPVMDGEYDNIWNNAQFKGLDDNNLMVDNLMLDAAGVANYADGEAPYRWGAMHDGVYLYIIVFGEQVPFQTPFADSTEFWHDDTIDIFWDGDDSKLSFYDGVDDYHVLIPLHKQDQPEQANNSDNAGSRVAYGFRSTKEMPLSDVNFATCICLGDSNLWEIRIKLESASIPVGKTIGFEIQVNDDTNGGDRDVKWGWFHPSLTEPSGTDLTWKFPKFMGTIRLDDPVL